MRRNNLSHEDLKDNIKRYWDGRSSDYGKFRGYGSEEENIAWKEILTAALGPERLMVLDIGTGPGDIATYLAEIGHDVTGIDFSTEMLKRAKERAKKSNLQITFDRCDAEDLYFEDKSFDAVICRYLLWTLPNPGKAVGEWIRVVKPGGHITVIDGKWGATSIIERLRRSFFSIGVLIYERRNPWKCNYTRGINEKLPFRNGAEPERVVELFKDLGLVNISVQELTMLRDILRRHMPLLYRVSWGISSSFLMKGEKSEGTV